MWWASTLKLIWKQHHLLVPVGNHTGDRERERDPPPGDPGILHSSQSEAYKKGTFE